MEDHGVSCSHRLSCGRASGASMAGVGGGEDRKISAVEHLCNLYRALSLEEQQAFVAAVSLQPLDTPLPSDYQVECGSGGVPVRVIMTRNNMGRLLMLIELHGKWRVHSFFSVVRWCSSGWTTATASSATPTRSFSVCAGSLGFKKHVGLLWHRAEVARWRAWRPAVCANCSSVWCCNRGLFWICWMLRCHGHVKVSHCLKEAVIRHLYNQSRPSRVLPNQYLDLR